MERKRGREEERKRGKEERKKKRGREEGRKGGREEERKGGREERKRGRRGRGRGREEEEEKKEKNLKGTLPLHRDKDASRSSLGIGGIDRQIGAAHHPNTDLPVHNEGQTDSILLPAEEALGAIDRIEGPVAALPAPCILSPIDRLHDLLRGEGGVEDGVS